MTAPHPLVVAAAEGRLPDWAAAGPERREHMARVSDLLGGWAVALGLSPEDTVRWRAVGYLHDGLRDEAPEALRSRVPPDLRHLPGGVLHGPAAAERLRVEGVLDGELLRAVAFHTVGDPAFRTLGCALYAADFLEPGRTFLPEWRAELRGRMPDELTGVTRETARARIAWLMESGCEVLPRTLLFWNSLLREGS